VVIPATASASYDRWAAQDYADQYWNKRNSNYKNFTANCQNYVSQCLKAGGIPFYYSFNLWYNYYASGQG